MAKYKVENAQQIIEMIKPTLKSVKDSAPLQQMLNETDDDNEKIYRLKNKLKGNELIIGAKSYSLIKQVLTATFMRLISVKALYYFIQEAHIEYIENYLDKRPPSFNVPEGQKHYRYWDGIFKKYIYISFNDRPQLEAYTELIEEMKKYLMVKPLSVHTMRKVKKQWKNWWRDSISIRRVDNKGMCFIDQEGEFTDGMNIVFENDKFFDRMGNNCSGEYYFNDIIKDGEASLMLYLNKYNDLWKDLLNKFKKFFGEENVCRIGSGQDFTNENRQVVWMEDVTTNTLVSPIIERVLTYDLKYEKGNGFIKSNVKSYEKTELNKDIWYSYS